MPSFHAVLSAFVFGAAFSAQTFVVDASNGPGTNFTSLPAAVAAAPDGALLLVRPGNYGGFTLAGKGLTILAESTAALTGPVVVQGTQPHQAVTLRGLSWPTSTVVGSTLLLQLAQCAGPVLLEDMLQPASGCHPSSPLGQCVRSIGLDADHCAQLVLRHCVIGCTAVFRDCNTVLESCQITGEGSIPCISGTSGRTAVGLVGGHMQLAGVSLLRGGDGWPGGIAAAFAGSGIFVQDANLRLLDGQVLPGQNGVFPMPAVLAAGAATVLRVAPRVSAGGTGPVVSMPALTGTGASLGGSLSALVATENGDLVVLAVGLHGAPLFVPGFQDAFWLDPVVHTWHTIAVQTAAGPVAGSIVVPNDPGLRGLRLTWQAACLGPNTGAQATNPSPVLVR